MEAILISEAQQHRDNFKVYLPDMIPTIEKYCGKEYKGGYYDHNVMPDLQAMDIFKNWDYDLLKHFAYTTNSYISKIQAQEAEAKREVVLLSNGFIKVTEDVISNILIGKYYEVISTGTNFLGCDVPITTKLKLMDAGERGKYWIKSASSTKGMPVMNAKFIKLITKN